MKNIKIMIIILLIGSLFSCAGIGKHEENYRAPFTKYEIVNEKYIDKPTQEVWDTVVKNLAKSFYMINNIEKESRIINVSFSTDKPGDYIDCGAITINTDIPGCNGETRRSENRRYLTAYSTKYIVGWQYPGMYGIPAPAVSYITRNTSLEGRINIYIAPQGNGTLVTVNTRYVFSVNLYIDYINCAPAGNSIGSGKDSKNFQCSFDTKNSGHYQDATCVSNGELEKRILSLTE